MKLNSWIELFNLGISNNEKCVLTPSSQKELLNYLLFPLIDDNDGSIMQRVAYLFGKELEEEFVISYKGANHTVRFTENGIVANDVTNKKVTKDMLFSLLIEKAVVADAVS